jgi:hypothetical protein
MGYSVTVQDINRDATGASIKQSSRGYLKSPYFATILSFILPFYMLSVVPTSVNNHQNISHEENTITINTYKLKLNKVRKRSYDFITSRGSSKEDFLYF